MKEKHMSKTETETAARQPERANGNGARRAWNIDPQATRVEFSIHKRLFFLKHLTVHGRFSDVSGRISLDERDPLTAEAEIKVGVASVDTKQARRNKHLNGADFFDSARYPTMAFRSRGITALDAAAGRYQVRGELTVRDVTKDVVLEAVYDAASIKAGRLKLSLSGTLNRRDYGIVWNKAAMFVSDEVTLALTVEAVPAS
jgi:polyisoprenoid-binding protein YceI